MSSSTATSEPLLPAIVWQDVRCGDDAAALDARIAPEQKTRLVRRTDADRREPRARAAWPMSRESHPELYDADAHVLLPKDYCALQAYRRRRDRPDLLGWAGRAAISTISTI